jgi:hypothetical protein
MLVSTLPAAPSGRVHAKIELLDDEVKTATESHRIRWTREVHAKCVNLTHPPLTAIAKSPGFQRKPVVA